MFCFRAGDDTEGLYMEEEREIRWSAICLPDFKVGVNMSSRKCLQELGVGEGMKQQVCERSLGEGDLWGQLKMVTEEEGSCSKCSIAELGIN